MQYVMHFFVGITDKSISHSYPVILLISRQLCTAHLQQIIMRMENIGPALDSQLRWLHFTLYRMTGYREHV